MPSRTEPDDLDLLVAAMNRRTICMMTFDFLGAVRAGMEVAEIKRRIGWTDDAMDRRFGQG